MRCSEVVLTRGYHFGAPFLYNVLGAARAMAVMVRGCDEAAGRVLEGAVTRLSEQGVSPSGDK